MTFISFLLHPWVRLIRAMEAVPRSLADDLLVFAVGANHCEIVQKAYSATFCYLHTLGAKIAASKCFLFSTCSTTRRVFKSRHWVAINSSVQVKLSVRDLGGQLNTWRKLMGTTVNGRIDDATVLCDRLAHRPWSRQTKQRVITTLILPTALYGAEAAPPAERPLARLASSMAKAIGPHSSDTSSTFSFQAATKYSLEPGAQILLRRLTLARRIICKHAWAGQAMQRIINHYAINNTMGAKPSDGPAPMALPACPPVAQGAEPSGPPKHTMCRALWVFFVLRWQSTKV